MKEIFPKSTNLTHRPLDIKINQSNTTKFGINSLRILGPHIWNPLPKDIKEETNYIPWYPTRLLATDFGVVCFICYD